MLPKLKMKQLHRKYKIKTAKANDDYGGKEVTVDLGSSRDGLTR